MCTTGKFCLLRNWAPAPALESPTLQNLVGITSSLRLLPCMPSFLRITLLRSHVTMPAVSVLWNVEIWTWFDELNKCTPTQFRSHRALCVLPCVCALTEDQSRRRRFGKAKEMGADDYDGDFQNNSISDMKSVFYQFTYPRTPSAFNVVAHESGRDSVVTTD